MSYKGFGYVVDSCPLSQEETTEAASKLNCSLDEVGRSQYVCVPNQDLTTLIEFCYTKTIVALFDDGHCLRTINDGFLDPISCKSFTEGCPTEYFRSTDLYKYPACHHLNTADRCFVAEPSCIASTTVGTSTSVLGVLNATTDYTSAVDESGHVELIIGIIFPLMILVGLVILICMKGLRRRRQRQKYCKRNPGVIKDEDMELNESRNEWESLLSESFSPETIDNWISQQSHIPKEVLDWDYEARCRYVKYAKIGTQTIHRARAMIVGCAGAGKTTLLKRLQHQSIQELKKIKSTVGLEVHENLFQIDNNCLKGLPDVEDTENKCLLSVVDFAGQSAYYACHQVYLSRRAFYLLVIDLSKQFNQKVDTTLCGREGTMFSDWTYGQTIIFWLKSIRTYCDDDTPVITIATHCEQISNKGSKQVYEKLLELLRDEPDLKKHLDRSRCFHVGFPQNDDEPLDALSDIEECIVNIALNNRWEETIPKDWAFCEEIFRKNKLIGRKIISVTDFSKQVSIKKKGKDKDTSDILRFYHDIGTILYFNKDGVKDTIIIDVQWFVDCFKHIITDPMHVRDLAEYDRNWQHFYESGYLSYDFVQQIWKKSKMDITKCTPTLKYMKHLGLIAAGQAEYYIPCVNKLDFGENLKQYISSLKQSTPVLVFRFRFLPHLFYFRLVVACMVDARWTVAEDAGQKHLFKNVVCFKFQDHLIVLAVNLTTIQAQIFRQGESQLVHEITNEIRFTIEKNLKRLTENFYKKTLYTTGYQCLEQNVLEENVLCFLLEDEIHGKGKITCPRHEMVNHHTVNERELLKYWKYEKQEETTRDELFKKQLDRRTAYPQAQFRKEEDGNLKVKEQETFYVQMWHQSIGFLECKTKNGTAFRVGKRYLMTAFHIIKGTVDFYLEKIIEFAQSDPTRKRNYSKLLKKLQVQKSGTDVEMEIKNGIESWVKNSGDKILFSVLIEALDVSGFSIAKEQASSHIEKNLMSVDFSFKREMDRNLKYSLKEDITFYSATDDVAILEVNGEDFPCSPFALDCSEKKPSYVQIVGYPSSHDGEKMIDSKCPLIPSKESWPQFTEAVQWWKAKCPIEDISTIKNAYDAAFEGDGKVQLHCSESTTHGASGSPGLILSYNEKPKVFLMLQEGFPSFAYADECKELLRSIENKYLVESGISMSRVYKLLSKKPSLKLRNELFHSDSQ